MAIDTSRARATEPPLASPGDKTLERGLQGAAGLLILSQALDDVNVRFTALAKALPFGVAAATTTRFNAVADVAAAAFDSLVARIDDGITTAQPPELPTAGTITETRATRSAIDASAETASEPPLQTPSDREADRLARAVQADVGRQRDGASPDAHEDDLEQNVRRRLWSSGVPAQAIDDTAAAVARRLRAIVDDQARDRLPSRPDDESGPKPEIDAVPRPDRFADASNPAPPEPRPTAQVLSNKAFFDRMLVAGVSRPKDERIAEAQLQEQIKTNAKLDEIRAWTKKPSKPVHAVFAPGRL